MAEKREEKREKILKTNRIILMTLIAILTLALIPMGQVKAVAPHIRGPRTDYLHITNYAGSDPQFAAIEDGSSDIADWPLTAFWVNKWIGEGRIPDEITLDPYAEFGSWEYDINNQRWPTGCEGLSAREGYTGTYTRGAYTWNMFHTRQRTDIVYTPANRTIPWSYDPTATAEDALNNVANYYGNGSEYDPDADSWKAYFDDDCFWCASSWGFRLAVAYTTNKDYVVSTILEGLGKKMKAWATAPGQEGFLNIANLTLSSFDYHGPEGDVHIPSLIFEHNMTKAAELLEAAGFKDHDTNGVRNDPRKVCGADKIYGTGDDVLTDASDLDELIFYMRLDDPNREAAGLKLAEDLETLDVPINEIDMDKALCFRAVMIEYNYHLYTGGYSFPADPYDIQYGLWHSSQYWYPVGWAGGYQGFCHVDNDKYTDWVKNGRNFYGDGGIFPGVRNGTFLQNKYVCSIPLWSSATAMPYRTGWEGVVNHDGYGISWGTGGVYFWSLYNMYKAGDDTIDWGFHSSPESINPVISEWVWDYMVIDSVYETLICRNPYNIAEDRGMLATSWTIGDWGPGNAYKWVEFTLKDNVTFHDGNKLLPRDVKFTLEFDRDAGPGVCWGYSNVKDIENVTVTQPGEGGKVKVFYRTGSAWALHMCGYVEILNQRVWMNASDFYGWGYDPTKPPGVGAGLRWPSEAQRDSVRDYLPVSMDAYDPTDPNSGPDGIVDLAQDGTGPWKFVGFTGPLSNVETIDLEAWRQHHMFQDEVELYIEGAFNDVGNVNYLGSVHTYAESNRRVDEFDAIRVEAAMFTDAGIHPHGTATGQYNADADFNSDTKVNAIDYATMGAHYGVRGG